MEIHGQAPWMTIEASADEIVLTAHLPYPTREEVCKCMSCPFSSCRDCIGKRKDEFREPHRPPVYDVTIIRRMVDEGRSSGEISSRVGCTERTARRYIRKFVRSA